MGGCGWWEVGLLDLWFRFEHILALKQLTQVESFVNKDPLRCFSNSCILNSQRRPLAVVLQSELDLRLGLGSWLGFGSWGKALTIAHTAHR